MACLLEHNWGWPRKRGSKDIQVCLTCGLERESVIHFDGPRYRKTQEGIPTSPALSAAAEQTRLQSAA